MLYSIIFVYLIFFYLCKCVCIQVWDKTSWSAIFLMKLFFLPVYKEAHMEEEAWGVTRADRAHLFPIDPPWPRWPPTPKHPGGTQHPCSAQPCQHDVSGQCRLSPGSDLKDTKLAMPEGRQTRPSKFPKFWLKWELRCRPPLLRSIWGIMIPYEVTVWSCYWFAQMMQEINIFPTHTKKKKKKSFLNLSKKLIYKLNTQIEKYRIVN